MLDKLRRFILAADQFLDDKRRPLNVFLLVGLVLYIGSQNPRIGDSSLRAILT